MTNSDDLAARVQRLEDTLEIQQLPIRYAIAIDERDVNTWVSLFTPDVRVGPEAVGRDALRDWISPRLRLFYRSMHQIVGHRVELVDYEHAVGNVYCHAEHEVGDRWIVMAIRYDDSYRKIDGHWYFERRKENQWYVADLNEYPQAVGFNSWHGAPVGRSLPRPTSTWAAFWGGHPTSHLTTQPVYDHKGG